MSRIGQAEKAFIEVRDELKQAGEIDASCLAWRKPRKFYREHSKDEALSILRKEAENLQG